MSSPDVSTTLDPATPYEAWETWGIASRWDPHHGWHHPTDEAP